MLANQSAPLQDDLRHVGVGFDVVVVGGLAPHALDRREGRARTRLAALAFDGGDQRGLFAADKRAGAHAHFQIEGETAAQNVLAQQAERRAPARWQCSASCTASGYSARQ